MECAGSTTTKYYYDGDQVIAEYEGSTLVRKFIYGPGIDEPICMIDVEDENAKYYYHYDALGSVVALSNAAGNVVESYSYDVFGQPSSTGSVGNPYFFTGRRLDTETGLYYYRFRYYKPDIGRFLQTDPIGYYDSMNLYTYCGNNPINWIDPWGLTVKSNWNFFWDWALGRGRRNRSYGPGDGIATYTYGNPGPYTVRLFVTDNDQPCCCDPGNPDCNDKSDNRERPVTVVEVDKVVKSGTTDEGPLYVCLNCTVDLEAKPNPAARFPPGEPHWTIESQPGGADASLTPSSDSAIITLGNLTVAGDYIVNAKCGDSDAGDSITVTVVKVDRIQYKIGSDAYQDAPSTLVVAKGADVTFKAIKNPSSAQWPDGKPVWSGSSGASGTGEEEEVAFDTASSNPTDYKVVQAECGNTVSVDVVVVDLSTLVINANRTSAPSETSYPVKSGEHIELDGTFKFDLMLNTGTITWPTPVKLGAEIWDLDIINEVIASGSGPSISHTFGTGEKDDGTCKTRFYFDNNTSGDSYTGWNDPYVDSPSYEAQELTYHYLTFGKSSAVGGTPGTSAACNAATDLILRKDTADDYRATAKLLPAGLSTIPASTHDPVKMERVPGQGLKDTWLHWSYFINYDTAEVIIVSDIIPCDANGDEVSPDTGGFFMPGTDSGICSDDTYFGGNNLAHEMGHSCGLPHNNANVDNVMYEDTAGNETLLTQSEVDNYE